MTQEKKCPCCNKNINEHHLYVKENNLVYHFSCYNFMKAKEEQEDNE